MAEEVTPAHLYRARKNAKLTAEAVGRLVYISGRMWRNYERGLAPIDMARYELLLIKTNQLFTHTPPTK